MNDTYSIETENLSIGYFLKNGKRKVIHNSLDLHLASGKVTCLLGLNGAGKSTLIRTLCGFQPMLSGHVSILGKELPSLTRDDFSKSVGVVLTEKTNAGGISVFELVALGRYPYTDFFGRLKEEDITIVRQSIDAVGIGHKSNSFVSELSDGERQKAMIAKALAQECPIIVLDEPTAFLDVTSRIETMSLLHKVATEQGKTILLSTHDLELAIQMGDYLWLQEREKPMQVGTPEDLILNGTLGKFFERNGITFDMTTGKLISAFGGKPIGIEGDFITSYWVGNAVVRNGFRPSAIGGDYPHIKCISASDIELTLLGSNSYKVGSIEELLKLLLP